VTLRAAAPARPGMILSAVILAALVSAAILESAFRWSARLAVESNERIAAYRYDPELGWSGIPDLSSAYSDSIAAIQIRNNRWGFRDRDHGPKTEPRIAVLGDSFVWGMHAQDGERFTDRLQALIPEWEVLNLGISGYGTDQEFLTAKRHFPETSPDVVFLMFCTGNDFVDNRANAVNRGYYKPYFVKEGGGLALRGVPVPKALGYSIREHPLVFSSFILRQAASLYFRMRNPEFINPSDPTREIILQLRDYSVRGGARFAVGLTARSRESIELQRFLDGSGIPNIDLSTGFCYRRLGWHWTPQGNEYVARRVNRFLRDAGLLNR
jgi:hypothetical protein